MEQRLDQLAQQGNEQAAELQQHLGAATRRSEETTRRLATELAEVAGLVERLLQRHPLPVPKPSPVAPKQYADRLAGIQPLLVESFRGSEEEIRQRLEHYPAKLADHAPVLDLGSGRGELLLLLGESGIEATGAEGDPALVQAARRRGLRILEGDVPEVLQEQPDAAWGAVTAIHLLEHLEPAALLQTLQEVRRILRPDGLLLAESPNPHSLRVGASLYWLDPTHQRPLLPETLVLFLRASGLVVEHTAQLHPFPAEQMLLHSEALPGGSSQGLQTISRRLDRLCHRLDELLNAPRDFAIRARKP